METKELLGLNLLEFGNTIQISGIIMNSADKSYLIPLPDDEILDSVTLPLNSADWKIFLRQTDILEVEVLANDEGKLKKAILRKSARQVDAKISWIVFKRDGYACRYCGRDDVPLTIDHLVLWEEGGPTIEENLLSSCKRCNKKRGSMSYADWLESKRYKDVSQNLSNEVKQLNHDIQFTLGEISIRVHITTRGSKGKKKRR